MNLGVLLTDLVSDTLNVSLPAFRPEACLAVTVVLLLLCRMLPGARLLHSSWVAFGGVLCGRTLPMRRRARNESALEAEEAQG